MNTRTGSADREHQIGQTENPQAFCGLRAELKLYVRFQLHLTRFIDLPADVTEVAGGDIRADATELSSIERVKCVSLDPDRQPVHRMNIFAERDTLIQTPRVSQSVGHGPRRISKCEWRSILKCVHI